MKKEFLLFALLFLVISGCKKEDSNPVESVYSNKITLGTGADYSKLILTGESDTFTRVGGLADIFWRLESEKDMGGSAVKMKLEKLSGSAYVNFKEFDYPNPHSYGHIMIASFNIQDPGGYRVTGILVNGNITVKAKDFIVE